MRKRESKEREECKGPRGRSYSRFDMLKSAVLCPFLLLWATPRFFFSAALVCFATGLDGSKSLGGGREKKREGREGGVEAPRGSGSAEGGGGERGERRPTEERRRVGREKKKREEGSRRLVASSVLSEASRVPSQSTRRHPHISTPS